MRASHTAGMVEKSLGVDDVRKSASIKVGDLVAYHSPHQGISIEFLALVNHSEHFNAGPFPTRFQQ